MRALITGVTPIQCNSTRRRSDYLSLQTSLKSALEYSGWTADWGPPELGWKAIDDGEPYDCVFVGWYDFESLTANRMYDAAYLCERQEAAGGRVVYYHDDWQLHMLFRTITRWRKTNWRKVMEPTLEMRERLRQQSPDEHRPFLRMMERWADPQGWPLFVVPIMDVGDGDVKLIERVDWPVPRLTRWNQVSFYPYFPDLVTTPERKREEWVYTTLFHKHDPWMEALKLGWPVSQVGGSAGVVSERMSVFAISGALGTLSPPHLVVDDGWARSRHWFGVHHGTAVLGDPRELGAWAPAYAHTPREFELMTAEQRATVIREQREQYLALTPSREEAARRAVQIALGEVSAEARVLVPYTVKTAPDPVPAPSGARWEYHEKGGLWFRPGTVDKTVIAEAKTYFKFSVTADDRVLDLGAHIGAVSVYALKLGASVVAVEPELENLKLLRANLEPYGDRAEIVEGAVTSDGSDLVQLWTRPGKGTWTHSVFERRGRVAQVTPSVDFAKLLERVQPTVIKADIEGAEYGLDWSALPDSVTAIAVGLHQGKEEWRPKAVEFRQRLLDAGWFEVKTPRVGVFALDTTGIWVRPGVYDLTLLPPPPPSEPSKPSKLLRKPRVGGIATEYRDLVIADDDVILDVGAHRGEFIRFVRSRSANASVAAYEPDPHNYENLQSVVDGDTRTFTVRAALTANAAGAEFLHLCGGQDTSMHSLLPRRGRRCIEVSGLNFTDVVTRSQPTILKIAIEGYEVALLRLGPLPDSVKQLAVKFHPSGQDRSAERVAIEIIERQGFKPVRIPNVNVGSWPVVGVWRRD